MTTQAGGEVFTCTPQRKMRGATRGATRGSHVVFSSFFLAGLSRGSLFVKFLHLGFKRRAVVQVPEALAEDFFG